MNCFNERSQQLIEDIYKHFVIESCFANFNIEMYDYENGIMIEFSDESQQIVTQILFYPLPPYKYDIWSIAIYGKNLEEKYEAINKNRTCFGLPVIDIKFDNEGLNPFVDVYIGVY